MKKIKIVLVICLLASCKNESKQVKLATVNEQSSKLTAIEQNIINQKDNSDAKLLIQELSKNYSKKYTCMIVPDGILKGDINKDGFKDVLFRYSVDDMENKAWLACGWFIAFSNAKNEFEKYIYFDWSSGPCAPSAFDFGFPTSIENGVISSNITDYDRNDGCCCPSIKRNMKFTYDKEFNFLALSNIETFKQSNNE